MNEKEIMTAKQVSEPRPFKMYYVYLLKNSANGNIYIGWTQDLKRRYTEHKEKNNNWKLVYYEAYISKEDAQLRERQLKQYGSSLGHLKERLKNSLRKGTADGRTHRLFTPVCLRHRQANSASGNIVYPPAFIRNWSLEGESLN